jgi:peptidoglycan hydrolase-like amidase
MRKWLVLLLLPLVGLIWWKQVLATDPIEDLQNQINELSRAREQSIAATKPLEGELDRLQKQLDSITAGINKAKDDLRALEASIAEREDEFSVQYALLSERVVSYYKTSRAPSSFFILFTGGSSGNLARDLFYQQVVTDRDKDTIAQISQDLIQLDNDKKKVEADRVRLADLQAKVDKEAKFFEGEIAGAKAYQAKLSQQIAALNAQQQNIIAQKLASLGISRSASSPGRCDSDLTNGRDPGFSPKLALFTYGVPHRNGLNQYGAWGRAKARQGVEQILQEYYPGKTLNKDYNQNIQINTTTGWSGTIEEYVKRIYEMPDSWTENDMAALKAQAVAARSYALNVTGNGSKAICTTEQCQVFKPEPKGGNWDRAVEATKGWVLLDGGNPAFTQYASTHGGYIKSINKFDGVGGNPGSFADLNSRAFDRESPWFYCDWGSRSEYNKTAWLKPSELADIANVILLARRDSSVRNHLYQPDRPNPEGTETWNSDRVKSELNSRGGKAFNTVNDGSVAVDFGSGTTNSISLSGDAGTETFSGAEFKDWFNLRAPANIQIVGPLYNVERR